MEKDRFPLSLFARIKTWLKRQPNARHIYESLRSEAGDVSYLEQQGALKSVVDCWRLVDGQDLPLDPQVAPMVRSLPPLADGDEWSHGLFGGYQCYDHEICNVFLPLEAAKNITQHFAAMLKDRIPDMEEKVLANKMVFGMSFNAAKVLFVDLKDGQVYIFTRKNRSILELAVPSGDGKDGFLRWFEEYARRLDSGYFSIDCLRPEEAPLQSGISLFPCAAPELTVCVTQGVEVRASALYMPEHQAGWTYSIAMQLVGTQEERGFEMCQLVSRHWEIIEEGSVPERVDGDGVIGLFPILVEGGWLRNRDSDPHGQYAVHGKADGLFRYASCLGRNAQMRTWFGGYMTFVPGTRRNPTGKPFRVRVEPFRGHWYRVQNLFTLTALQPSQLHDTMATSSIPMATRLNGAAWVPHKVPDLRDRLGHLRKEAWPLKPSAQLVKGRRWSQSSQLPRWAAAVSAMAAAAATRQLTSSGQSEEDSISRTAGGWGNMG
eukprot:s481_g1.t1